LRRGDRRPWSRKGVNAFAEEVPQPAVKITGRKGDKGVAAGFEECVHLLQQYGLFRNVFVVPMQVTRSNEPGFSGDERMSPMTWASVRPVCARFSIAWDWSRSTRTRPPDEKKKPGKQGNRWRHRGEKGAKILDKWHQK